MVSATPSELGISLPGSLGIGASCAASNLNPYFVLICNISSNLTEFVALENCSIKAVYAMLVEEGWYSFRRQNLGFIKELEMVRVQRMGQKHQKAILVLVQTATV
jgi:hypothetical protein